MNLPLLQLNKLTKHFGSYTAVNGVDLTIYSGEIIALLGENGAGKSTLIKMLAGIHSADGGEIFFHQQKIHSARDLLQKNHQPIVFIHQDLGLIEWMTVAENMAFVMGFPRRWGLIDWQKIRQQTQQALDFIGVSISPDKRVFELSRTEKSLLAIARAIAVKAEILVLDEPTASLPAADVAHLFDILHHLKQQGVGMIYVTHRLDEVRQISERILVMRDGCTVAQGKTQDYSREALVSAITGSHIETTSAPQTALNNEILTLNEVKTATLSPLSFTLHQGEILALAGLRGAGQEEIGRLLFGLKPYSGEIRFKQQIYHASSPKEAIEQGIALVAGDRGGESLVLSMSVQENLFLNPILGGSSPLQWHNLSAENTACKAKFNEFDIRPRKASLEVRHLSGGNQQKVVLARWLQLNKSVLILEDPTAGVDIGARAEIYRLLQQALTQGLAILLISTDFEEVVQLAHRALVFNRGQISGQLSGNSLTLANLLTLASG